MTTATHLNIVEVFDTVQGEGPLTGRQATFLRMAGCNLSCTWCDTPYSWDWTRYDRASEVRQVTIDETAAQLADRRLVVLTGGEPLLQRVALTELAARLPDVHFQVETNGTVAPGALVWAANVTYVVSPKLANSGDSLTRRWQPDALDAFADLAATGRADWKIVVTSEADIEQAVDLADHHGVGLDRLWLMPQGITCDEHLATLARLADPIVASGANLSARVHLLAWPNITRGR